MDTLISKIHNEYNLQTFANKRYEDPDFVMIHISKKELLRREAQMATVFTEKNQRIFGMKIIWTRDINEDDIICTYDLKYKCL